MQAPILIIEDDDNDILLLKRVLKRANISHPIALARNADEAIQYLSEQGKPFAILSDWGTMKGGGLSVLKWMKENKRLRDVPVTVLSGSVNPADIEMIKGSGASFLTKPTDLNEFNVLLTRLYEDWKEQGAHR